MSVTRPGVNTSETEALFSIFKFTGIFALYVPSFARCTGLKIHYCADRLNRNSSI
jgi:hypothetical protein